ncbi:GNAT family N-acetyltransferase [Brachybacterium rhamnosum]|uniref:GNAT family N-acetyltransferase n=1 Tax=Brachybacterium rhamnosum TaxID=173361 RepID=A0ABW4PZC4_9MICO
MLTLDPVAPAALDDVLARLAAWQREELPVPLHPRDLAWALRRGEQQLTAALRTWSRDREVLAVGFLDGPDVLRLGIDPAAAEDEELAARLRDDLAAGPGALFPAEQLAVELRHGLALDQVMRAAGWTEGEPWTPLRRPTAPAGSGSGDEAIADTDLAVSTVDPDRPGAEEWAAVIRSGFPGSTLTGEHWQGFAAHSLYARYGRTLLGRDREGTAAAAAVVWSDGPGRPGLLEPIAVSAAHRRRGYGRAISLAAVAALEELGASSAMVATPSTQPGAVRTYRAAGFVTGGPVRDLVRPRPSHPEAS